MCPKIIASAVRNSSTRSMRRSQAWVVCHTEKSVTLLGREQDVMGMKENQSKMRQKMAKVPRVFDDLTLVGV